MKDSVNAGIPTGVGHVEHSNRQTELRKRTHDMAFKANGCEALLGADKDGSASLLEKKCGQEGEQSKLAEGADRAVVPVNSQPWILEPTYSPPKTPFTERVEKLREALPKSDSPFIQDLLKRGVLVIGPGIAGCSDALVLAKMGIPLTIRGVPRESQGQILNFHNQVLAIIREDLGLNMGSFKPVFGIQSLPPFNIEIPPITNNTLHSTALANSNVDYGKLIDAFMNAIKEVAGTPKLNLTFEDTALEADGLERISDKYPLIIGAMGAVSEGSGWPDNFGMRQTSPTELKELGLNAHGKQHFRSGLVKLNITDELKTFKSAIRQIKINTPTANSEQLRKVVIVNQGDDKFWVNVEIFPQEKEQQQEVDIFLSALKEVGGVSCYNEQAVREELEKTKTFSPEARLHVMEGGEIPKTGDARLVPAGDFVGSDSFLGAGGGEVGVLGSMAWPEFFEAVMQQPRHEHIAEDTHTDEQLAILLQIRAALTMDRLWTEDLIKSVDSILNQLNKKTLEWTDIFPPAGARSESLPVMSPAVELEDIQKALINKGVVPITTLTRVILSPDFSDEVKELAKERFHFDKNAVRESNARALKRLASSGS